MSLREAAVPHPGPGEVLIRVHHAAICGTDVRILSGRKTRDVRRGYPIGHECAGTVAALGEGVSDYRVGERVGVCVVVSCGDCAYCRASKENLCETRITLGYHTDGAFADYMLIPSLAVARGNLFKLPEAVAMEVAPLLEPMACCINGQHEMGLTDANASGQSLVVFGAGPIGLIHLLLARTKGVARVTVVEPRAHRRETASSFGADEVISPEQLSLAPRFDSAILAVGVPDLVNTALHVVRKHGRINLFAGFDKDTSVSIDPNLIHYGQFAVTGASESRRCDYAEAAGLVESGRLDPRPLITHRFRLEDHEEAVRVASDGSALKVAFDM